MYNAVWIYFNFQGKYYHPLQVLVAVRFLPLLCFAHAILLIYFILLIECYRNMWILIFILS